VELHLHASIPLWYITKQPFNDSWFKTPAPAQDGYHYEDSRIYGSPGSTACLEDSSIHCTETAIKVLTFTFYRQVHSFSVRPNSITKEFALQVHCKWLHGIAQAPTPCSTAAHVIWGHLWYSERTVHCRYIPPAQHSYDYDRVGTACKGRVGVMRGGKSMLEPSFPEACPLVGLENPLDSLALCAVYLPGGKGVGEQSVYKFCWSQHYSPQPTLLHDKDTAILPNIDLLSNWLHS